MSGTLGNLSINVNADASDSRASLQDLGTTARQSMQQSQAAVSAFAADLNRSSDNLQAAATQIGGSMTAANDAIIKGSTASAAAVQKLADTTKHVTFDDVAKRAKDAFTNGIGDIAPQAQSALDRAKTTIESSAKGLAIGLALGVVSATAAAVYAGYRVVSASAGFLKGLVTGESYKSDAINNFAAINAKVVELQDSLLISARDANGMLDVFARLGVDKDTYVTTFTAVSKAVRDNSDQLDRLGVKYKDSNGAIRSQQDILASAKGVLDQYTEGYDRNAAAAAIGIGSYKAIGEALKANAEQLAISKDRLDEYGLAIGPQQQAELARYQQAMRDFNNEAKLTGDGFKRAISDSIMPALTDLAELFKDGFPFAVQAFRYSLATVTSLLYGLKTVADIAVDGIKGGFATLESVFDGTGNALMKLFHGDFTGATDAFKQGLAGAVTAAKSSFDEITADATKNRDRMLMAFGFDDRTDNTGRKLQGTKKFKAAPDEPDAPAAPAASAYANFLQELDRMVTKVDQSEYAMLRLKAAQLAAAEGITNTGAALKKITDYQRGESQNAVDAYTAKLQQETQAYAAQTSILGLNSVEQEVASLAMQKRQEVEQMILKAAKDNKPYDDQAIADLKARTEATIALDAAQIRARDSMQRSGSFGAQKALEDYRRSATDAAANTASFIQGTFSHLEDAIATFAETGKLNLGGLFKFMADEFIRQETRMLISSATNGAGGSGGAGGLFGSLGTLAGLVTGSGGLSSAISYAMSGGNGPIYTGAGSTGYGIGNAGAGDYTSAGLSAAFGYANGLDYVPYDGFPAILHEGEKVTSRQDAATQRSSGGAVHFDYSGQTINVGQGVSRSEVYAAMQQTRSQTKADVTRQVKTGRLAA